MGTGGRRTRTRRCAGTAGIGTRCAVAALAAAGVLLASAGLALRWPLQALAAGETPAVGAPANGYGPGVGPQAPGQHWGGAYTLANVAGYAYCVQPGGADPLELPADQWAPAPYPGSGSYSDGEMAALAYFAERYQGTGYPGWTVDETVAAIEQVAYGSAGGSTPPGSQGPAALVTLIEQYMSTYAGPWSISLSMTPPSGSTFDVGANYTGTVTVTSATGNGVGGLELSAPPTGGPSANQISNFEWLAGTTNDAGQISFQWNVGGVPPTFGGAFSAQGIDVVGGAVGTAPPAYAPPAGSGGQLMVVSGASETLGTSFGGIAEQAPNEFGTVSIVKAVPDTAYYGPAGAQFEIEDGYGTVFDTLTTGSNGQTPVSVPLNVAPSGSPYRVHETVAPPGYGLAPDQVVMVYPGQNTVASFTGPEAEPVLAARLGAEKVDAQTGQPLAGATFSFAFDTANDGTYDQELGSCTTGGSGTCQPPTENAAGGWLPGWYQVTETAAPPGYWLDPASAVQTVFLQPGATALASVTFGDELLGSLRLVKTGNDTAYWPVTGATFTVQGPAPSSATVGTLTAGDGGVTNTLTGLVPGTYTVTETTAPPGYTAVPPLTVAVAAGHTTTSVTVADPVQPGTVTIRKTDRTTGAPLAGGTFDVRYDSNDNGSFNVDLGTCTTDLSGTCSPAPTDGSGLLPGTYLVTEVAAPPGYYLPTPPPSQQVTVAPGGVAAVAFADPLLVPARFHKVATGSVNPTELVLSGAVIHVTSGPAPGGSVVATCTTDASGACQTAASLVSGQAYCWTEVSAPPGLQAGATGCFTAGEAASAVPIVVTDPGLFVGIAVKKVDAADPAAVLAGAVYDLFRVGGAGGTTTPAPPSGVTVPPGQAWVARATSGQDGIATFPLQLPGYAYCVAEVRAPPGYVLDTAEHCTGVLAGSTTTVTTTLTLADTEATVSVTAHKFNASVPGTGVPGAVYDLYVEGSGPPSGPPGPEPPGAPAEPGDTWWARGTTGADGVLSFPVPAGYAWCFHEVSAPPDYTLDPALHCTAVITTATPAGRTTVALPETLATVFVDAHKFNARQPGTAIPGATYELVLDGGPVPPGYDPPPAPAGAPVPVGDTYWTQGTTDPQGRLSFAVPAGYRWCLRELAAPSGYQPDTSYHCTAVLTSDTATQPVTVALPEQPVAPPPLPVTLATLAFTGGPDPFVPGAGLALMVLGAGLWLLARSRGRRHARRRGEQDPIPTNEGGAP